VKELHEVSLLDLSCDYGEALSSARQPRRSGRAARGGTEREFERLELGVTKRYVIVLGMVVRVVALTLAAAILGCSDSPGGGSQTPASPGPQPQPPAGPAARLLVVTHTAGFRHDSIPAAENALRAIGTDSGLFQTEFCRTADEVRARLTPSGLTGIDAVFFANTTGNLGIPDLGAFLAWISGGRVFLGAHSASDTYHESPDFLAMLGGEFTTHGSIVEAEVRVNDASHPAVSHLAPRFRMTDE
jgi:hypothetical protein